MIFNIAVYVDVPFAAMMEYIDLAVRLREKMMCIG